VDRRSGRRVSPAVVWCAVACCAGLCGCANFWDDVTAKGETWNQKYHRLFDKEPDPLVLLQDEKCKDGTLRARAFRKLDEPKQHGGSDADQDLYVKVLVTAASQEATAPARMAAIEMLGRYKDPRVVKGLEDAYYHATDPLMPPDSATVLRCQALLALGATRQPTAIDLLTKVLKAPPVDKNASEVERQHDIDERAAAIRSLAYFNQEQSTTALVGVLKTERDGALRGEARLALSEITGANLPEDAKAWDDYLHDPNAKDHYPGNNLLNKILPVSFRSQ
jgi:HEAT repeat protein